LPKQQDFSFSIRCIIFVKMQYTHAAHSVAHVHAEKKKSYQQPEIWGQIAPQLCIVYKVVITTMNK